MQNSLARKSYVDETDLDLMNPSKRAEATLADILAEESRDRNLEDVISVETARHSRPVIDADSGRTKSRVLFVTADENALIKDSSVQQKYLALADVFDEIHVMVVLTRHRKDENVRLAHNVWLYNVSGSAWWRLPFLARDKALKDLVFGEVTRPDVVVATDPYLAGWSAYLIARDLARPLQVHIKNGQFDNSFTYRDKNFRRNNWLAKRLLKRVLSVRVESGETLKHLEKKYKKIIDLKLLPQFFDLNNFRVSQPTFNVHEKYPEYKFVMLTFGALTADSSLHSVFSAAHSALLNPRVGLVVIGDGPAKKLFAEKVKLLGIEKKVIFIPRTEDVVSYFKTCDVLIEPNIDAASDERILQGIVSGVPILAAENPLRLDLLKDGENAFLCPVDDTPCFAQKVTRFLNQSSLRTQFGKLASDQAAGRINEDPISYYRAYRDNIEAVITAPVASE